MRVTGHKLIVEWSGERGPESSSTGRCICGRWEESASTQKVVRQEYRYHLRQADRDQRELGARLRNL